MTVFWSAGIVNVSVLHDKTALKVKVGVTFKLLWKIVKIETKYSEHCKVCGIVQVGCNVTFVYFIFQNTS
jgi:hypothetical protein